MIETHQVAKKPGLGVVVARFQVPLLSAGHQEILQYAKAHQRMVVCLGTSPTLDVKNPLPYEARAQMVRAYHKDAIILPILDVPDDNPRWSANLDTLLECVALGDPITLYGGRDSFLTSYVGRLDVVKVQEWHPPHLSGTSIREGLEIIDSAEFRSGLIWGIRYSDLQVRGV